MSASATENKQPATTTTAPTLTLETFEHSEVDGSKVVDRKAYVVAGKQVIEALGGYTEGMLLAGEASRLGAEASIALRLACHRGDNDAPDWAGNTQAYAFAWGTNVVRASKALWPDLSEDDRKSRIQNYRDAVRRYMSDTQALKAAMAVYAAQNDEKVKTSAADVRKAIEKREKIPADVKQGIERQQATQVTTTGKRLNGMEKESIAANFGPKAKSNGGGSTRSDNASSTTPVQQWGAIRAQITEGKLAPADAADEILHLVTAFVLGPTILGPIDEKIPAAKAGRKKAIDTLRQCHNLIGAALAVEDGKGEKKALAEHVWSERK